MLRERTIAQDYEAGTSTGGRVIIAPVPVGVGPDGRPVFAKAGQMLLPASHEKMKAGIGVYFAADLQRKAEGMGERAAARLLGLSRRSIRRLRARSPLEKVKIGFPRPQ